MQFDPENKVVQLCAEGMNASLEGKPAAAKELFQQAWDIASNDFEAFTAAHYMARVQTDPNEELHWNHEALRRADAVNSEELKGAYPSLYLNLAKSYETLNQREEAHQHYKLAASVSAALPEGKYSEMIRFGIHEGLNRTGSATVADPVRALIDRWCERRDLKPLAMILPVYMSHLGSDSDGFKLNGALRFLSATRCLPAEEQAMVDALIAAQTS